MNTHNLCVFLTFSLNGKYIATSGFDKHVLIWDVTKTQDIERHNFEEVISSMTWKPHGNALAVIDVIGKYGVWDSVVPSSMASPTEERPTLDSKKNDGLFFFEEEEKEISTSGSMSDHGEEEDSFMNSEQPTRKRLRNFKYDEDSNDHWWTRVCIGCLSLHYKVQ